MNRFLNPPVQEIHVFPMKNEHFCKTNKNARGEHRENTWANMKKGWTNEEKMKNPCVGVGGAHVEQKHSYYWGKCATEWARGNGNDTQKDTKNMKTMKTLCNLWCQLESNEAVRQPSFSENTLFPGKMGTFVKPTRKQEENTSKTHEKNMKKWWKNMPKWKKMHVNFLGALLKQKHSFYWWNFTTTWPRALKTTPKNTPKNIKKHEIMMNTNEHTRECSFSENTRFPGEDCIFVKTNMKHQRNK